MSGTEQQTEHALIPEKLQWIAEAAYYRALSRDFAPNQDHDDWFAAQKDYEALSFSQRKNKNGLVYLGTG